jgi:phosphoglycerate dehydrogenase-like enzyme
MSTVIYLGPAHALGMAQSVLEPRWPVVAPELSPEAVGTFLADAVAVLDASMRVRFDRAILERAPGLRVISTATTGADHIDAQVLADRKIPLFTLASEKELLHNLTAAAEHSWLLLMASARGLRGAVMHVLDGQWRREGFPGILLRGKTLGLVGCGRIGSWMARYARAFHMDVVGHDPFVNPWPEEIRRLDLDELLACADFISIHVPLNDQTRGLIGKHEFARMKPGAVLINTSRGSVTDERALLASLQNGRLAAAGLDVLEGEPAVRDHCLVEYARTHENLIITPHIGGFCPEAVQIVVAHAARRIVDVLAQSPS